jgi:hypothetical protein
LHAYVRDKPLRRLLTVSSEGWANGQEGRRQRPVDREAGRQAVSHVERQAGRQAGRQASKEWREKNDGGLEGKGNGQSLLERWLFAGKIDDVANELVCSLGMQLGPAGSNCKERQQTG